MIQHQPAEMAREAAQSNPTPRINRTGPDVAPAERMTETEFIDGPIRMTTAVAGATPIPFVKVAAATLESPKLHMAQPFVWFSMRMSGCVGSPAELPGNAVVALALVEAVMVTGATHS
jgi:hypothetical protein